VVIPALRALYDYAWFIGGGTSALVYWLWVRKEPVQEEVTHA